MSTKIILVRHGETEWNKEDRIQGHRDVPLTELGRDQAKSLGTKLRETNIRVAYASDLSRARETAEIALRGLNIPLHPSPALRERSFGAWEGKLWKDIVNNIPEDVKQFRQDPLNFAPQGGETWITMQRRVFSEVKNAAARHVGETIAVFTHGGPTKAVILEALDLPSTKWRGLLTDNASLSILEWNETTSLWQLLNFNDTCHLNGMLKCDDNGKTLNGELWHLER